MLLWTEEIGKLVLAFGERLIYFPVVGLVKLASVCLRLFTHMLHMSSVPHKTLMRNAAVKMI
jgi:hypothetical protein